MKSKVSKLIRGDNSLYISIPADLVKDSSFSFKEGESVQIEIRNDLIIVTKTVEGVLDHQRENEDFLHGLLKDPEFVTKNFGRWVIIKEGKLWNVLEKPCDIFSELEGEQAPTLIAQLRKKSHRNRGRWFGGSLRLKLH